MDDGAFLQGEDASDTIPGSDASTVLDDAGLPSDTDGAVTAAGACNDLLHGLEALGGALLGPQAAKCASSSDCPAGQCCYASATASACVKQ